MTHAHKHIEVLPLNMSLLHASIHWITYRFTNEVSQVPACREDARTDLSQVPS